MKYKAIAVILETTKKVIKFDTEIGKDMTMDASEQYDRLLEDPYVSLNEEYYDSNIRLCCYACRKLIGENDFFPAGDKLVCADCARIFEAITDQKE